MSAARGDNDVVIVDTGGANLASLTYAFERLNVAARVSIDVDVIQRASHVVLPGVGAAGDAMDRLNEHRLTQVIADLTQPVLGICLGMHLLARHSAEDDTPCLGILDCDVIRIPDTAGRVVPHMGWNETEPTTATPLLGDSPESSFHYYVHSFAITADAVSCAATFDYGDRYAAIVQQDNFFATQFHPERSAAVGQQLLENFLSISAC